MKNTNKLTKFENNEKISPGIEKGINSTKIIAKLSTRVFRLDKEGRTILGILAKNRYLNENQIVNLSFEKSHNITRDVVRYRLSQKKNQNNFLNLGLVVQKYGLDIGNFKKPQTLYSLTLKGFLASLSVIPFEQTYMTKMYRRFLLRRYHSIPNFDELPMLAIKYDVAMFLFDQAINGHFLDDIKNIADAIAYFNNMNTYQYWNTPSVMPKLTKEDEQYRMAIQKRYCITGLLVKKILSDNKFDGHSYSGGLIKYWYEFFKDVSIIFPKYGKYSKKISERKRLIRGRISMYERQIIPKSKKILEELGFRWKDEEVESTIWQQ